MGAGALVPSGDRATRRRRGVPLRRGTPDGELVRRADRVDSQSERSLRVPPLRRPNGRGLRAGQLAVLRVAWGRAHRTGSGRSSRQV